MASCARGAEAPLSAGVSASVCLNYNHFVVLNVDFSAGKGVSEVPIPHPFEMKVRVVLSNMFLDTY
jgi:hypothetical protein